MRNKERNAKQTNTTKALYNTGQSYGCVCCFFFKKTGYNRKNKRNQQPPLQGNKLQATPRASNLFA